MKFRGIFLCVGEAFAFDRVEVQKYRAFVIFREFEDRVASLEIVTVEWSPVIYAQIVEEILGDKQIFHVITEASQVFVKSLAVRE